MKNTPPTPIYFLYQCSRVYTTRAGYDIGGKQNAFSDKAQDDDVLIFPEYIFSSTEEYNVTFNTLLSAVPKYALQRVAIQPSLSAMFDVCCGKQNNMLYKVHSR